MYRALKNISKLNYVHRLCTNQLIFTLLKRFTYYKGFPNVQINTIQEKLQSSFNLLLLLTSTCRTEDIISIKMKDKLSEETYHHVNERNFKASRSDGKVNNLLFSLIWVCSLILLVGLMNSINTFIGAWHFTLTWLYILMGPGNLLKTHY